MVPKKNQSTVHIVRISVSLRNAWKFANLRAVKCVNPLNIPNYINSYEVISGLADVSTSVALKTFCQ